MRLATKKNAARYQRLLLLERKQDYAELIRAVDGLVASTFGRSGVWTTLALTDLYVARYSGSNASNAETNAEHQQMLQPVQDLRQSA
ncbi:hypothetical protein ARSEF4850_006909 [Beauveria asiatica]